MNWLYSKQQFNSKLNGAIIVRRLFGRFTVDVHGKMESSPYTDTMWRHALKKITQGAHIKHVLLLGLAGGSAISAVLNKFPHAHITALEWDHSMEKMFKLIRPKEASRTATIIGDAQNTLTTLTEKFDLILFDLYQGSTISQTIFNNEFAATTAERLAPNGYFLINYWLHRKASKAVDTHFLHQQSWRFRVNSLSLYRPALPEGYERYRAHPAFTKRETIIQKGHTLVHAGKATGLRVKRGPLWVEKYIGLPEPQIEPFSENRIVFWQPLRQIIKPAGWHTSLLFGGTHSYGMAHIANPEYYWEHWSSHAKRHRKKWLQEKDREWEIRETSEAEFCSAFAKARMGMGLSQIMIQLIKYKIRAHGPHIQLYAARRPGNTEILAGLAVMHIPEAATSVHLAAFHLPPARHGSIGTGLIDVWYQQAIAKHVTYIDFGVVRANGEPRSWQGYSDFKSQFLTHTVFTPKSFYKLIKKSA